MLSKLFSFYLLFALVASSCKKDHEGTASISIRLKDLPAVYQQVNIEVTAVQVHSNSGGWMTLDVTDTIYDLLLLQDSANAALGTLTLPSGIVSQVRLILGAQNTVMADSVIYDLELSSQDESGLKLNIHQDLIANQYYTLVLDLDAEKSVKENGDGTYKLMPVMTAEFQ